MGGGGWPRPKEPGGRGPGLPPPAVPRGPEGSPGGGPAAIFVLRGGGRPPEAGGGRAGGRWPRWQGLRRPGGSAQAEKAPRRVPLEVS